MRTTESVPVMNGGPRLHRQFDLWSIPIMTRCLSNPLAAGLILSLMTATMALRLFLVRGTWPLILR